MLRLLGNIPHGEVSVALSGGVDSVVAAYFLSKTRKVTCYHFNHQTPNAPKFQTFVQEFCAKHNLQLVLGTITEEKKAEQSWEEYWRIQRYAFLKTSASPVVTGHNLDDQVETWIWACAHGQPRLMPYARDNIIRPFLLCTKKELTDFAQRKELSWVEDPSNEDTSYMRNFIRHELTPKFKVVNPGIEKVLIKKMVSALKEKNNGT